jgi:hypothetical protein
VMMGGMGGMGGVVLLGCLYRYMVADLL